MSTGYKIQDQDELHYLTFQIVKWVALFTRQIYRDIVINSLNFCQKNEGLEIDQKAKYIHDNPVRAGIVNNVDDYLYSSARNYADLSCVLEVSVLPLEIESRT
ncbi:hypothetical protein LJC52_05170, partial [Bacteroidales bacterium OttesenSCG-928-A17]|nr:hypothetical protein [Bacteroidales bacterium OttesenSCG-928-A17]